MNLAHQVDYTKLLAVPSGDDVRRCQFQALLPYIPPSLVTDWPYRIQWKAILFIHALNQELSHCLLCLVGPRLVGKAVPHNQVFIIQFLREVVVKAFGAMSNSSTISGLCNDVTNQPIRSGVPEPIFWTFRMKASLAFFLENF